MVHPDTLTPDALVALWLVRRSAILPPRLNSAFTVSAICRKILFKLSSFSFKDLKGLYRARLIKVYQSAKGH